MTFGPKSIWIHDKEQLIKSLLNLITPKNEVESEKSYFCRHTWAFEKFFEFQWSQSAAEPMITRQSIRFKLEISVMTSTTNANHFSHTFFLSETIFPTHTKLKHKMQSNFISLYDFVCCNGLTNRLKNVRFKFYFFNISKRINKHMFVINIVFLNHIRKNISWPNSYWDTASYTQFLIASAKYSRREMNMVPKIYT